MCMRVCAQATARTKIAAIVSDLSNEAVTKIAALRETLLQDETIKTVASLEPVALDVSKVVDAAVKESGGDEATARTKIAQIVSDTTNKAVFSATAALRDKLLQDETVKTVASLEPVALDVSKVVDAAVKDSGGDEVWLETAQTAAPRMLIRSPAGIVAHATNTCCACGAVDGACEDRSDRL